MLGLLWYRRGGSSLPARVMLKVVDTVLVPLSQPSGLASVTASVPVTLPDCRQSRTGLWYITRLAMALSMSEAATSTHWMESLLYRVAADPPATCVGWPVEEPAPAHEQPELDAAPQTRPTAPLSSCTVADWRSSSAGEMTLSTMVTVLKTDTGTLCSVYVLPDVADTVIVSFLHSSSTLAVSVHVDGSTAADALVASTPPSQTVSFTDVLPRVGLSASTSNVT